MSASSSDTRVVVGAGSSAWQGSAGALRRGILSISRSPRLRVVGPLLLLAGWQLLVSIGEFTPSTIPSPLQVLAAGWALARDGTLGPALAVSVGRVAAGLAIGVLAGTALGLLSGMFKLAESLIDPPMQMIRTMPTLALVPLFIIWFGIGEPAKLLLIAFGITCPIYVNLHAGIRGVDSKLMEAAQVFGMSALERVRDIVLPGALASWLVGLRFSMGMAWIVLVAAEQINASSGLGFLMSNAQNLLETDVILFCLLVYSMLGLATDTAVRMLESRALAWRRGLQAT